MLEDLRSLIAEGISNDIAKYALPEAYKVELAWSINARSLQNFLALRSNKAALWEIRELAFKIFEAIPEDHKYLFENYLYKEKGSK
jgi:thymidylate synthase (FAD)